MSQRTILPLLALVLFCFALPAHGQSQLPAGPGEEIVRNACSACHSLNNLRQGHTREDWTTTLAMMRNVGAQVGEAQVPVVLDYLTKNFPERPKPAAVLLPGREAVSFQEWTVPTPGARPHDPLAYPDGTIWFTGHMGGFLGRIDPKTGAIKEYRPPTLNAGPHGLTYDKNGKIWFTENFHAAIGELDPKTGAFKEYPLDPAARDPHTPLFDPKGRLFFTVQGAGMVGRLDPATGAIKLVRVPTPKANPYGMVMTSKGIPYFCEFGANKLASIDPETLAIHEYVLPHEESRPRRIAITPDDVIYYGDYSRGYLGEFDTKTNAFVTEWPSPSGPHSLPYGIAFLRGAIWYSESGAKPNTLVRFDPAAATFQTWAIPSGGGVVRNMMPTRDGNLVLTESGVNKVALVTIK